MERLYKIKKGLDLNLKGKAVLELQPLKTSGEYAIVPDDFHGMVPRLVVKEGEQVLAGQPLFVDKATERIKVVSPVSGTVSAIVRGERRKILRVCVKADAQQENLDQSQKGKITCGSNRALSGGL